MKPQKLSWLTVPLMINLVLQVLSLLVIPFLMPFLSAITGSAASDPTVNAEALGALKLFTGATLWIALLFGALWAALIYFTYRDVKAGRSWARVAAIIIAVLSLLNVPIGTILGIVMLIGAFDQDVQRYFEYGGEYSGQQLVR